MHSSKERPAGTTVRGALVTAVFGALIAALVVAPPAAAAPAASIGKWNSCYADGEGNCNSQDCYSQTGCLEQWGSYPAACQKLAKVQFSPGKRCKDVCNTKQCPGSCYTRYKSGGSANDLASKFRCDRLAPGESCNPGDICSTTYCAQGVCCDRACTGTCMSCALGDHNGACTPVPYGQSGQSCTAAGQFCDGKGGCAKEASVEVGGACSGSKECKSGSCANGVCCASACSATCMSCNQAGSVGTCKLVPRGQPDQRSCGPGRCDGAGVCKKAPGQDCSRDDQCAVGKCMPKLGPDPKANYGKFCAGKS